MQPMFSSQPVVTKMKCCSKTMKCSKEKEPPAKQCDQNACNPFMACAYGNFYLLEKSGFTFTTLSINKTRIILVNDNRLADNLSDCWHPPRKQPAANNT